MDRIEAFRLAREEAMTDNCELCAKWKEISGEKLCRAHQLWVIQRYKEIYRRTA